MVIRRWPTQNAPGARQLGPSEPAKAGPLASKTLALDTIPARLLPGHPAEWFRLANHCPPLAGYLLQSMVARPHSLRRRDWKHAFRTFLRRPRWLALARGLREPIDQIDQFSSDHDDKNLFLSMLRLAQRLSDVTGWSDPRFVYWKGIAERYFGTTLPSWWCGKTGDGSSWKLIAELETLSKTRRCLALASIMLHGDELDIVTPLCQRWPILEQFQWKTERNLALSFSNPVPFSDGGRQRLLWQAKKLRREDRLKNLQRQYERERDLRFQAHEQMSLQRTQFTQLFCREFSAGAGHEINNPLTAILHRAQSLLKEESAPERRDALHHVIEQVDRIRWMIRDLQVIGRPKVDQFELVDLTESVRLALQRSADRVPTARRVWVDDQRPRPTWSRKDDAVRIISELISNAAEAVQRGGKAGEIRIEFTSHTSSQGFWELSIEDDGPGFADWEMPALSIPFYSGRSAGRGLGMGLPVVQRLLHDSQGELILPPAEDRPTKVRVRWPIRQADD